MLKYNRLGKEEAKDGTEVLLLVSILSHIQFIALVRFYHDLSIMTPSVETDCNHNAMQKGLSSGN